MRLIWTNSTANDSSGLTAASLFETKYDWLMRWAMHFAQNDRAMAEDLVQDAFVRLMNSWPRIKDNIREVEPVLYSYLRYAYLTELRRGRRFNFEELSLIEFDDVRLSLKEEKSVDPIETQDDLRRIVAYLCWRKRSAKSASVLLLRFFHGYFPDEIARIAALHRGPINELLRVAREEVKAYLTDPLRVEIMRHGKPPEMMPTQMAVSPEQFAQELRKTIFASRTGSCLDRNQWTRYYDANAPKPLSSELLAHVVSCRHCLEIASSNNGLPPLSQHPGDGSFNLTRRSRRTSGQLEPASKEEIRRVIEGGMKRFRQLYEHHPHALSIVINGDVLATRDVSSTSNELRVQLGLENTLDIVEVVSEQNIPLLTFYVGAVPPQAPPEQSEEIALSDDRKLQLRLQFIGEGSVIEVFYHDPTLLTTVQNTTEAVFGGERFSEGFAANTPEGEPAALDTESRRRLWWRWFLDHVLQMELPEMNPMLATAIVCAVATAVFLFLSLRTASVVKPGELLQRAAVSENEAAQSKTGVVIQTVRIQTPGRRLERTIYRDIQHKRRAKDQKLNQADITVRTEIEAFAISWNDPLSAASFRDWHDHATIQRDVVKRPEKGLLRLTTTVAEGAIASESLTIREADLRPVERTVELRDAGTIEIAELNYNVLPWSSVNPELFEPVSDTRQVLGSNLHAALHPHIPHTLSVIEIDEAELGARLVLNRLHLDTNDRVTLVRQANGVQVKGVVADEATQHQLQAQLYTIPHVSTSILTLEEMVARPTAASEVTSIRQSSLATAETQSALERYFSERGMDRVAASASVQEFVDSAFTVRHESEQINDLLSRFLSSEALSMGARTNLSELLIQHKAALLAALARQDRQLLALQLIPHSAVTPTEGVNAEALRTATVHNFALCTELTSDRNTSRSAQVISAQLADSIAQMRSAVLHIPAAAQLSTSSSVSSPTANRNK